MLCEVCQSNEVSADVDAALTFVPVMTPPMESLGPLMSALSCCLNYQ